jgi:hypothetical protein
MAVKTKYQRQVHPIKGKTMTEQHHAKTCNINWIMQKYAKTGLIDHVNRHQASYGDVSRADFETAMNLVCEQQTEFEELPAKVRAMYEHNVVNYLEALETEEGRAEHANLLNPQEIPAEPANMPETGSEEPVEEKVSETETVT